MLNQHYRVHHHIPLNYENIHFESFEEFEKWKSKLELETICQYRKYHKGQKIEGVKFRYVCHRSGIYKPCSGDRKRKMKLNGTKRLGGHCPAEIVALRNRNDDSCDVTFQNVHVGHEVGTKSELKHTYLSKEEKLMIATKLSMGLTTAEIVRKQRLLDANPETGRLEIVKNAVYNVKRKFKTDVHRPVFDDDLNMQAFIARNNDSILYFKDKLQDDERYGVLGNTDYMIVIMDAVQEENLRRYGHKVVAIDSTRGTDPQDYLLHTLLVANVDFEGCPVAFALTNRNDYDGISVFLTCIRDRVGVVKTRTLMSDMHLTYLNCWSDVMQPPERHLYCIWHVYDRWKKNLTKISNVLKRKEIKEQLYALATEMDVASFEENLQSFLLTFEDETKDFIEYFSAYYAICCEKWAYCYRPDAEMNTNMYLERFHGIFNKNLAKGKKIESITSCLKYLFEYLKIKEKDYLCKEVKGKISTKLRILRCRHKTAENELSANPITIQQTSNSTWLISAFTDSSPVQETYTVKRRERETVECADSCTLLCVQCQTCFHRYKCTCQDSSVKNNMCKHIHVLGIIGEFGDNYVMSTVDDKILSDVDDTSVPGVIEAIVDDTIVTDIDDTVEEKSEELKKEIERAVNICGEALQHATNVEQVREIIETYLNPIEPALKAANITDIDISSSWISSPREKNVKQSLIF